MNHGISHFDAGREAVGEHATRLALQYRHQALAKRLVTIGEMDRSRQLAGKAAGHGDHFVFAVGDTFFLAGYAALIAVPVSILLGLIAALYRGSLLDRWISSSTLAVISFPEFFVAYILILIFAVQLGWFPSLSGVTPTMSLGERLYVSFLPALTMVLIVTAHMMRMTRAAIVNLLALPYIEMAELKVPVTPPAAVRKV